MKAHVNDLNLEILTDIFSSTPVTPTQDFFIAQIQYSQRRFDFFREPFKYSGYGVVYCTAGKFNVVINLREYSVEPGMMIVYTPGTIISFYPDSDFPVDECRAVVVAGSHSLISDIQIDLTKVYDETISVLGRPCFMLTDEYRILGDKYFALMVELEKLKLPSQMESIKMIFKSMFSTLIGIMSREIDNSDSPHEVNTRAKRVFESFLKLVTQYHHQERYLDFYAEKLCLTPKYLSATVKSVSGRSAPEWIDSFVIVDAKNLLKYSNYDVKEIGFKLNFNAPSVFCRFFKAQTGMTPSEYRNK